MAYGDLKVNNLIYDTGSGDASRSVVSIPLLASPTFTGTPAAPTASAGTSTTQIATTAFVATSFAPLASPTLTGTPAAPTAAANTNTTQIATTAFVMTEVGDYAPLAGATFTGTVNGTSLILSADLTVNGTTTTINTTNLDVEDKNITLGKVSSPSDTTASGGGITLKGATDKTITWSNSTGYWEFSHSIEVAAGKFFKDDKGKLRSIPANAQSSAHVAVAADAGKAIYISTGGVTLNNSVFSAGDAVTIINNSGSDQTITQGSGVTLYNSADASSGNRTLAARGMATVWFASASVGYISGAGLS